MNSSQEASSFIVDKTKNINIHTVGNESTPILICDDVIKNKDPLVEHANHVANFELGEDSYYPGYRAALPQEYVKNIVSAVAPIINKVYQTPKKKVSLRSAFYSFVAKKPEELSVPQRLPHIDSQYSYGFAILHYLNDGEFGGTGFFRHKRTSLERVHPKSSQEYAQAWEAERQDKGPPEKQYFTQSDELFELIYSVDYRPNRLFIYPSNLFHSGLIRPQSDIHQTPKESRLTANIFLDFL